MQITVTPHRIFWLLVAGSLGLTAMSVADHFVAQFWVTAPDLLIKALDRFELDREASFPTWYSAALLGVCSALPSVIAHVLHQRRSPDAKYWTGLAFMFLFCSVDEVATVHESLRLPAGIAALSPFRFAWIIPGIILVVLSGGVYARFLFRLPTPIRLAVFVAGVVYFSGALGMEIIDGRYLEAYGEDFTYTLLTDAEELLEMLGASLFVYAFLSHLRLLDVDLHVRCIPHPDLVVAPPPAFRGDTPRPYPLSEPVEEREAGLSPFRRIS